MAAESLPTTPETLWLNLALELTFGHLVFYKHISISCMSSELAQGHNFFLKLSWLPHPTVDLGEPLLGSQGTLFLPLP